VNSKTGELTMKVTKIEGVGSKDIEVLRNYGIFSTDALLKTAADRRGRRSLSLSTGIPERTILNWVNLADLMRIPGVGQEYSNLLEEAGVDSVRELGTRRPENLHRTVAVLNTEKSLVGRPPSLAEIRRWVAEAKRMVPMVTH
jgi:predicted flap endonuclease-1-like 5' DNA nuclease